MTTKFRNSPSILASRAPVGNVGNVRRNWNFPLDLPTIVVPRKGDGPLCVQHNEPPVTATFREVTMRTQILPRNARKTSPIVPYFLTSGGNN